VLLNRWQFLVRLLLVICLSFSFARLFWLLLPLPNVSSAVVASARLNISTNNHEGTHDSNTASSNTASSNIMNSGINVEQLKSLHVFGKAEAIKKQAVPAVNIPSSETQLGLLLLGVVSSNIEQLARAIIAVGNKQEIYAIGAALPAGDKVTLAKVMTDRIIISNNGQFEALFLYQHDAKTKTVAARSAPKISLEQEQKMLDWQADHTETETLPPRAKPVVYSTDQAVTEVGRSMSDVVTMSVYHEGGTMAGYKISPGRDADKFKALGLQTGDVVIAINGWPMSNPAQIVEMYQEMGNANSASLQIKRGTNVMTVDMALQ
jgi:general secretion pathway protein C